MTDWNHRFLELAEFIATWSKDPSTQVGAVIVDSDRRVRGHGYNGFPRGVLDLPSRYADRPTKYAYVVHAEANAILNSFGPVEGCMLYSTLYPCAECAKLIIQAGIVEVHYGDTYQGQLALSQQIASDLMLEAGVKVVRVGE